MSKKPETVNAGSTEKNCSVVVLSSTSLTFTALC